MFVFSQGNLLRLKFFEPRKQWLFRRYVHRDRKDVEHRQHHADVSQKPDQLQRITFCELAAGVDQGDRLYKRFVQNEFNVQQLLVDIALVSVNFEMEKEN